MNPRLRRFLIVVSGLTGLLAVYLFQRESFTQMLSGTAMDLHSHPYVEFIINRIVRLLLNDLFCILLIYAIFQQRSYLRLAFLLLCFELFVLLPVYLVIKLSLEGTSEISSPLLSQVHRLVVNPLLMFILMAGFYYQEYFYPLKK